ncbi:restriction endonuclease subunit S [Streptomyces sp. NPDC006691]|uniref:restriction endonuclease subunit S n=1 Tax=Streptomyces sp. NPDC006691 TaxID=3364757 RepID=UPI0036CF536A
MSEWPKVRFDQFSSLDRWAFSIGPFGSKVTTGDYRDHGVPFIRGVNLAKGIFTDSEFVFISDEKANEIESAIVRPGDIVFTRKGTVGQVSMIPRNPRYERYAISGSQVKARIDERRAVPEFYYYWFRSPAGRHSILEHAVTTGVPSLANSLASIRGLMVPNPPYAEQLAMAQVLGALDDKIAINDRIAATSQQLALSHFSRAVLADGSVEVDVESVSSVLTRGIAPKYSEVPDDLVVLNQKCIREGRVSLAPARLTLREKVKEPKLLHRNDVLVNSTGVGTLGRVARWTSHDAATVDSHITIVRFDGMAVDPVCAGFAMLHAQPEIEAMGEGSTGQTELRRAQLGALEITLPSRAQQQQLRPKLDALEESAGQALAESVALVTLRDTLLPQLMSGRIRVSDAEKIVEDHA